GTMEAEGMDERSPELMELSKKPGPVLRAAFWGMNLPWTLGLSTCIGIYLMFSPAIFNLSQWGAHIFHLGGALVVVASVIAMGEIVRIGRYLNLLIGLALAALPWFLAGSSTAGNINGLIAAICVMALSIPVGKRQEKFGYWERWIK
ncbi:MAG TPA: vitamin K epoxide reductase, partial [Cryomorphaceae bacterium]|nr:vitamin K epoxide reductase [Cryomorphaceae bacterium]